MDKMSGHAQLRAVVINEQQQRAAAGGPGTPALLSEQRRHCSAVPAPPERTATSPTCAPMVDGTL